MLRLMTMVGIILSIGSYTNPAASREACMAAEIVVRQGPSLIVTASGEQLEAASGMALCPGDRLIVGETLAGRAIPAAASPPQLQILIAGAGKTIRLSDGAELVLPAAPEPASVTLVKGLIYVFSLARSVFSVEMDLAVAGIDGTEFAVHRVLGQGAVAAVREGSVSVRQRGGEALALSDGEVAFAAETGQPPKRVNATDAARLPPVFRRYVVQRDGVVDWAVYFPPQLFADDLPPPVTAAFAERRYTDAAEALACTDGAPAPDSRGAVCAMLAVLLEGTGGPVPALDAVAAPALDGPAQWLLAQSYVAQAQGDLQLALALAEQAAARGPGGAFATARAAELLLLLGDSRRAVALLEDDGDTCSGDSHRQAVLGLGLLIEYRRDEARAALDCALRLDPSAPLAWTASGLWHIRSGALTQGRRDLETAAALDPRRADTRVWLARALLDDRQAEEAARNIRIALEEDPEDPNAHLTAAIARFAANDPVGALEEIRLAEALGEGRATIRSNAGLGEDRAVRGAALSRVFQTLGFDALAVDAGARAAEQDPTSPAANRQLADALRGDGRDERTATSANLRASLLSPPSSTPLQPRLLVNDLGLLETTGPSRATFSEFAPLFDGDGVGLQLSGGIGTQETLADEVSANLLYDNFSLALGQFHLQSDGFRENNDISHDILAAQASFAVTPRLTLFGQYIYRDTEAGDRLLRFDLDDDVFPNYRGDLERNTARLGFSGRLPQGFTLLGLGHWSETDVRNADSATLPPPPFPPGLPPVTTVFSDDTESDALNGQLQLASPIIAVGQGINARFTFGGTTSSINADTLGLASLAGINTRTLSDETAEEGSLYGYATIDFGGWSSVTVGLAGEIFHREETTTDTTFLPPPTPPVHGAPMVSSTTIRRLNPKLGLRLMPTDEITLRAAYTRSMVRYDADGDTLEPVTVAGFPQFFNGNEGSIVEQLAAGGDIQLLDGLNVRGEAAWRRFEFPALSQETQEVELRGGVDATFGPRWSGSAELRLQRSNHDGKVDLTHTRTVSLPLSLRYFDPSGFFGGFTVTPFWHEFLDNRSAMTTGIRNGDDQALLVDAAIGWRLPNRLGQISLEVQNLFDQDFGFEERPLLGAEGELDNFGSPTHARERALFARATFRF